MKRNEIINKIGAQYLTSNTESDEFNYQKALTNIGKNIDNYYDNNWIRQYKTIDLRFTDNDFSILIETKTNFDKENLKLVYEQLNAYIKYEKQLTLNKIIGIIANIEDDRIIIVDNNKCIDNKSTQKIDTQLKSFIEYKSIYFSTTNNKISVIQSAYKLNEILFKYGINEKIRSQFVGTCLLALKHKLMYKECTNYQIRCGIEEILINILNQDSNKHTKLAILKTKVLDSQDIKDLKNEQFRNILYKIETEILPYINEESTQGQDLLNLFFTIFNKYTGKADKNQAFTPDHIAHFMCKVCNVNKNSYVLDPCCGSGTFLVRALTEMLNDCDTKEQKEEIKQKHIFGIEYEEIAFGLTTTNMLIQGVCNSNIIQGNCFDNLQDCIKDNSINVVLMNPPYNAHIKNSLKEYADIWNSNLKADPSKGFHYVYYIANKINKGKLAVLLPIACAIGNDKEIKKFKELMLAKHHLDAVFSLPNDLFYPGANVNACCMIFDLGTQHNNAPIKETFFGYYKNDGFIKKKNLGRVEKNDNIWQKIEQEWLSLYFYKKSKPGCSIVKYVTAEDEWLAEAHMETNYENLQKKDFEKTVQSYLAFLINNNII